MVAPELELKRGRGLGACDLGEELAHVGELANVREPPSHWPPDPSPSKNNSAKSDPSGSLSRILNTRLNLSPLLP